MSDAKDLEHWCQKIHSCKACALHEEGNRGPTIYSGSTESPLMIVGEGPGGVEDIYGVPLVGPSGKLLDKALWSVGVTRDKVYVTNIVKCRPRDNRTLSDEEGRFCANLHLKEEIKMIQPKVIITLGKVALHYFNQDTGSITRLRGKWLEYNGIPLMPTFHPAYLLRLTGKDLVNAKWNVYYDLKAAVDKAKELDPHYEFANNTIFDLLTYYESSKKLRQL